MATAAALPVEPDIRLEDYLDDKLQSSTDLDNIDTLLASVEVQRSQLQAQLDDAVAQLDHARHQAHDRQGGLAQSIREFDDLQHSIDLRLRIMNESDAPDDAIRRLEPPMNQLRRVDLAHRYVSLLQDVENMRLEARAHLPHDPKAALRVHADLRALAARLHDLQRPADEAAAHLVRHVDAIADALWAEMKATMSADMEAILRQRGWPHAIDPATHNMDPEWLQCFEKLVDLQVPEVLYSEPADLVVLLPFEVMAKPFVQWFRFQFMGTNATSSPQSFGTFCIPQFVALLDKWADFFRDNVGYILGSRFADTGAADKSVYVDPACALVAALLPVMREKIHSAVQHGLKNPQFLSSLIVQLMNLDDDLRSRFDFDGGDPARGWAGLTSEVLDAHFDDWLRAEKEFALERFDSIIDAPDARRIDYDYAAAGKMKPTLAAIRIVDLLRSVTAQYQRVTRVWQKTRFLLDIQLEILDRYHARLRDSLEAYYSATSTLGRTLHGVSKEQAAALEGTGTFEILCRVIGGSDHIISTLRDWSNEEFFVTFWEQLHSRAKEPSDSTHLGEGMSWDQVKNRTSSAVGSDGDSGGILFDETIAAFAGRRATAQEYLVTALVDSHAKAFRQYMAKAQWSTIGEDVNVDPDTLAISPELDEPLSVLRRNLTFLSAALSTAAYRRAWRAALDATSDALWTDVLMRHRFAAAGAAQLARDVAALAALADRLCPGSSGTSQLRALVEATSVLSLPLSSSSSQGDGGSGEEEKGGDGNGGQAAAAAVMTLGEAADAFFTDNARAKDALDRLGLDALSPTHARNVVQRRVEYQG